MHDPFNHEPEDVDHVCNDGYRDLRDSTERLAWQQGDVAALLESDVPTIEELIEVANSME
ncbi:MAG: hypothetical protein GEU80_04940 [Dehalococcoidia bacterium]|nr:hypothetical protein [Dehalococcoidia bacterium]